MKKKWTKKCFKKNCLVIDLGIILANYQQGLTKTDPYAN